MSEDNLVNSIDNILPQTQCGLCGYAACRPYAQAIVENNERINLCLPGGIKTLSDIGKQLNRDITPFITELEKKTKLASRAVINESECIGCTKCIQACPVDAIIGSSKKMHTVISQECTGCELCISPCPVDCITMVKIVPLSDIEQKKRSNVARDRYYQRQKRLSENFNAPSVSTQKTASLNARKAAIQDAIARVQVKKGRTT